MSQALTALLERAVQYDYRARFKNAQEMLAALNPAPVSPPRPAQPNTAIRSFDFVTARVDEQGRIVERINAQVAGFEEDLGHGVRLQMIEIPAGIFRMGSTDAEVEAAFAEAQRYNKDTKREWFEWETPRHRVAVPAFG